MPIITIPSQQHDVVMQSLIHVHDDNRKQGSRANKQKEAFRLESVFNVPERAGCPHFFQLKRIPKVGKRYPIET